MSSFGIFLVIVGVTVGVASVGYATFDLVRRRNERSASLRKLEQAEREGDEAKIGEALDDLAVRDLYARNGELRERVHGHLRHLARASASAEATSPEDDVVARFDCADGSFHIITTYQAEGMLLTHPVVAEAAVVLVSITEEIDALVAFVVLRDDWEWTADVEAELYGWLGRTGLTTVRPNMRFVGIDALPKTATGQVMRRDLEDRVREESLGDSSMRSSPIDNDVARGTGEESKERFQDQGPRHGHAPGRPPEHE